MEKRDKRKSAKKARPRILLVENTDTLSDRYRKALGNSFRVTLCKTGSEVAKLVNDGAKFDLAIMDVILPPEEEGLDLENTGLRLIDMMRLAGTCRRFIINTVRWDIRGKIERICDGRAVWEYVIKQCEDITKGMRTRVRKLLRQKTP